MTDVEASVPVADPAQKKGMLVKEKSVTMEYFLETSHLDKQTAELLRQYDKDGDGSFSKNEVVAIILDLREAMQSNEALYSSNKLFKRLLTAAVAFCVLLLTSMFGLSYAVAVLTAKTDVGADGSLVASGTGVVVSTDSRANVVPVYSDEAGRRCFSQEEKNEIMAEVFSGKNVILQDTDIDGSQKMTQLNADGASVVNDQPCFPTGEGQFFCFFADVAECSGRRQLGGDATVARELSTASPSSEGTSGGVSGEPCTDCQTDANGEETCGWCAGNGGGCSTCRRELSERVSLRERRLNAY
jgi:hypothetical protein